MCGRQRSNMKIGKPRLCAREGGKTGIGEARSSSVLRTVTMLTHGLSLLVMRKTAE